jgi:hypothetical protein
MAPGQTNWIATTKVSEMDYVKTMVAATGSFQHPAASLVVLCKGGHAEAYVNAPEIISPEYGVRVRFDDGKPTRQYWTRATDYHAVFTPNVAGFLRKLTTSSIFYFEYTPYQEGSRVVSFNVSHLPTGVYDACVKTEIDTLVAREKKIAAEEAARKAQQERERKAEESRRLALGAECAAFTDYDRSKVERAEIPLPTKECWERKYTGTVTALDYDDVVKRRKLCSLESFAHDPKFCGLSTQE